MTPVKADLPCVQTVNLAEMRKRLPSRKTIQSYGMTEADAMDLFKKQNFKCNNCKRDENWPTKKGIKRPFEIDHDHKTGKVRVILCTPCNQLQGTIEAGRQTPKSMVQAYKTLLEHGADFLEKDKIQSILTIIDTYLK